MTSRRTHAGDKLTAVLRQASVYLITCPAEREQGHRVHSHTTAGLKPCKHHCHVAADDTGNESYLVLAASAAGVCQACKDPRFQKKKELPGHSQAGQ